MSAMLLCFLQTYKGGAFTAWSVRTQTLMTKMSHMSYFVSGGGLFGLWLHCLAKGQWKGCFMGPMTTLELP